MEKLARCQKAAGEEFLCFVLSKVGVWGGGEGGYETINPKV